MRQDQIETLDKVSFPLANTVIAWEVFLWVLHRIDDYGRWQTVLSLEKYSGILSERWFTPVALIGGLLLVLLHVQVLVNRGLRVSAQSRLVDAQQRPIVSPVSYKWLAVVFGAAVVGTIAAGIFLGLWLRFYDPPLPLWTLKIPVPLISKTPAAPPRAVRPPPRVQQATTGQDSPIVSGSGNFITYNRVGPQDATPEQKKQIRIALAGYLRMGIALRDRCATDDEKSSLEADANAWWVAVQQYLNTTLDESFQAQFVAVRPSALQPGGVPHQRMGLWRGINHGVETLDKFIDQFR